MMNRHSQVSFIANIREINWLYKQHTNTDFIEMGSEGVCNGLAYVLLNKIKAGQKEAFFKIYHFLCDTPAELIVDIILATTNDKAQKLTSRIARFLSEVVVLQQRQCDAVTPAESDPHSGKFVSYKLNNPLSFDYNPSHNNQRVTDHAITMDKISFQSDQDLLPQVEALEEGQQLIISFASKHKLRYGHTMLIYKDEFIHVFDANKGDEMSFARADLAVSFVIKEYNMLYTKNSIERLVNRFSLFNNTMFFKRIAAGLIKLTESGDVSWNPKLSRKKIQCAGAELHVSKYSTRM